MNYFKVSLLLIALVTGFVTSDAADFEPYSFYSLGQETQTVAIGDLNGDGRRDVAVACSPSSVAVLFQQEDGALGEPVALYSPNMPLGIAVGDLDGDGRDDLAVGGSGGAIFLYYQQDDGTLSLPTVCLAYNIINGLVIDDINSDGKSDLLAGITTYTSANYPGAFLFTQDDFGQFGLPWICRVDGGNARCISTGDFSGSGVRDLAVLLNDKIAFVEQDGFGMFYAPDYLPAWFAYSLAVGDVTGDALDDMVFAAPDYPGGLVGVYSGGDLTAYQLPYPAQSVTIADIDGDGRNDVVTAHGGYNCLSILLQDEAGALMEPAIYDLPSSGSYQPQGLAAGDLNSDGSMDLVLADPWNGGLVVLLQVGSEDTLPPVCSASVSGTTGLNGWYTSPAVVTLSAADNDGGTAVGNICFTTDGSNWIDYTEPVSIRTEGVTDVAYYAEDGAGNRSDVGILKLKLDLTPPVLTLTPSVTALWPPTGNTVQVPVAASGDDGTSGLANLHLKVIDEYGLVQPEMETAGGVVLVPLVASRNDDDPDGRTYTLVLTGTDVAGNVSSVQSYITVPKNQNGKKPKNLRV